MLFTETVHFLVNFSSVSVRMEGECHWIKRLDLAAGLGVGGRWSLGKGNPGLGEVSNSSPGCLSF